MGPAQPSNNAISIKDPLSPVDSIKDPLSPVDTVEEDDWAGFGLGALGADPLSAAPVILAPVLTFYDSLFKPLVARTNNVEYNLNDLISYNKTVKDRFVTEIVWEEEQKNEINNRVEGPKAWPLLSLVAFILTKEGFPNGRIIPKENTTGDRVGKIKINPEQINSVKDFVTNLSNEDKEMLKAYYLEKLNIKKLSDGEGGGLDDQ